MKNMSGENFVCPECRGNGDKHPIYGLYCFKCGDRLEKANQIYDIEIKNITEEELAEILEKSSMNDSLKACLKQGVTREGLRCLFSSLLSNYRNFTTQDSNGGWTFNSKRPLDTNGKMQGVGKFYCEWKEMNPKDELKSPEEHGTLYIIVTSE